MKVWLEFSYSWFVEQDDAYFAICAFKHRRREWKGFTVQVSVYKWIVVLNAVNDYKAYTKVFFRKVK